MSKTFEFAFKISALMQGNFKATFGGAGKEIAALNAKINDNKSILGALTKAQKAGIISAESYKNATIRVRQEQDRLAKAQEGLLAKQSRLSGMFAKSAKSFGAAWALGSTLQSIAGLTQNAIKFESAMADVRKVVDFDTPQQFKAMSKDILDLSTKIPMTAEGLAQIVAAGGQSGIARDELTSFAESAAKMGIAFDVTADQAGEMMAKWRTAFKMNQTEVVDLADKINFLGNTTAASAPLISDVVTRIGPLGSVGGVASGEIAALGASMVGAGINSEIAATGIKNMILSLVSGPGVTKAQSAAFAQLGIDSVQLAKDMQTDARGSILNVLKSIQQLDKASQATVMKDLFGKESLGAIAPLLSNLDGLQDNFNKVAKATNYAGSMEKEFAARADTTENSLVLMNNRMDAAKVAIAQGILPAITPLAEIIGNLASGIGTFASTFPGFTQAALTAATAVIAFGAAGSFARGIFFGGKWLLAGITQMQTFGVLAKSTTIFTQGLTLAQNILGGSARMLGAGFMKLWGILMANPWIALATVAIGAAWMIYNNWDTIKQWFTTLWDNPALALSQFCDGVKNLLSGAADWVREKWQSISEMLSTPIFGKVNISASGNGQQVAQNAAGGIYGRGAFLTSFAENDGESAIPHTPNRRNIGLLAKTNEIMGSPLGGNAGNITATFAPQITVNGGSADTAEIDSILSQKMREFEEMLKRISAQQRRLSYA